MPSVALPFFKYGTASLPAPREWHGFPVLTALGLPPLPDPDAAWDAGAHEAAHKVAERLNQRDRLALVIPDRTRALPLPRLLPVLIARLAQCGIPPERISLVPASGIHRPMSVDELRDWVGPAAAESGLLLAPHDADAPAVFLGKTAEGIPVAAHPAVAAAGAVLVLGRIVFHYLAGFGGGRKMLVPGVAARGTILAMHSRCLHPTAGQGRHPLAQNGILEGNPVHGAACAAARLFPPAFALHIQMNPQGQMAELRVGDLFGDHQAQCLRYGAAFGVTVPEPLDAVVVSAGGYPTDRDLVQSHKALEAVAPLVRDGGLVIFIGRCQDGIGNPEIERGLRLGPATAIEAALRRDFQVGVHTALALRLKTDRLQVLALSELGTEAGDLVGWRAIPDLEAAARAIAALGPTAKVALAPAGGTLLYRLGSVESHEE